MRKESINIAICEDIPQHASRLASQLEKYYVGKETIVIHKYENCGAFLEEFRYSKIEYGIVFLDIMMPNISGLEAAKHIRFSDESVPIVFITSAAEHAIDGYQYAAISFLIKPVDETKLFQTLDRIERQRALIEAPSIMISSDGYVSKVLISSITSVERHGRKTLIYRTSGKAICTSQPIDEQISMFSHFALAYQSNYINLQHVVNIDTNKNVAMLSDGRKVVIGRRRIKAFLDSMFDYVSEDE